MKTFQEYNMMDSQLNDELIMHMLDYREYLPLQSYLQSSSTMTPHLKLLTQLGDAILHCDIETVNPLAESLDILHLTHISRLKQRAYFYYQGMQLNFLRHEYGDYFRALSPFLVDVLRLIIERHIIPQLNEFMIPIVKENAEENRIYRGLQWKQSRVEQSNNIINQTFKKYYGERFNYDHYVSSSHLVKIIEDHSKDQKLKQLIANVRHVEKYVRNIAAHEVVYVDNAFVTQRSGLTLNDVQLCVQELMHNADLTDQAVINILTEINQRILQALKMNDNN
ncbi:hypothetical protein HZY86_07185 [Aerococcaceae bacterium DSM 111020]|nr:hypothetical protein [Aerococcaceae bacterium DSM 111020]